MHLKVKLNVKIISYLKKSAFNSIFFLKVQWNILSQHLQTCVDQMTENEKFFKSSLSMHLFPKAYWEHYMIEQYLKNI